MHSLQHGCRVRGHAQDTSGWLCRQEGLSLCTPVYSLHQGSLCTCRQAVPLAIALLFVSNPDVQALDALSRLSHDANLDVAQNAVLALGRRAWPAGLWVGMQGIRVQPAHDHRAV